MTDLVRIGIHQRVTTKQKTTEIVNDLNNLFKSERLSDVALVAFKMDDNGNRMEPRKFHVHKAILGARSEVFCTMFQQKYSKESLENCVEIEDIDADILKEMLRFIYTGKVYNVEKVADRLLIAAEKYSLNQLKTICEQTLISLLTIENVAEIILLAKLYSAQQLLKEATNFLAK